MHLWTFKYQSKQQAIGPISEITNRHVGYWLHDLSFYVSLIEQKAQKNQINIH